MKYSMHYIHTHTTKSKKYYENLSELFFFLETKYSFLCMYRVACIAAAWVWVYLHSLLETQKRSQLFTQQQRFQYGLSLANHAINANNLLDIAIKEYRGGSSTRSANRLPNRRRMACTNAFSNFDAVSAGIIIVIVLSATMAAAPTELVIVDDGAGCVAVPDACDRFNGVGGNAVTAVVSIVVDVCVIGSWFGAGKMQCFGHASYWTDRC